MSEKIDKRFQEGTIRFHCMTCKKFVSVYRKGDNIQCFFCNQLVGIDDEPSK